MLLVGPYVLWPDIISYGFPPICINGPIVKIKFIYCYLIAVLKPSWRAPEASTRVPTDCWADVGYLSQVQANQEPFALQ